MREKDSSNQNLSSICEEVFELENLGKLDISYNQIQVGEYENSEGTGTDTFDGISTEIIKLTNLEELYLQHNNIKEIPEYLADMTKLKVLDLSSNSIEKIPKSLLNLTNLEELNLKGNTVSKIKGLNHHKSPKEIIEFILFNQNKEMTALNEAKILVLGDESSGKSSLVERMVYDRFDEEYTSTKGIDIEEYKLENSAIKVKIWDFAGQEITYQIHNLFMSQESLYLLVVDGQKEDDIVEHFNWLETIGANANYPPIIIVVTKKENNRTYQLDKELYLEKFPNIVDVCYVSSKEDIGFDTLKSCIEKEIKEISNMHFPKEYIDIKEAIERKDNTSVLEASEFQTICKDSNISSKEERANVRKILSDIGTIIGLDRDDRHIINPIAIIDESYEIIRSREVDDKGKMPLDDPDDNNYNWIIQFLIKNNIAFKVDDFTVMIPSRLPVNRPDNFSLKSYQGKKENSEDFEHGLNFRYRYIHGFKRSVLFEFIIGMQESIKKYNPVYWANGVCWEQNGVKVAILLNRIDKTIDIHIPTSDKDSRILLTTIHDRFVKINKENTSIFVIEEIAIVKDDEIVKYISHDFLKVKKQKKDKKVEVEIHQEPYVYDISELIDKYEREEQEEDITNKPLLITEGKTDKLILEIAWKKLYDKTIPYEIQVSGVEIEEDKKQGSADLVKRTLELDNHANRIIIGVFDNDAEGNNQFKGLKKNVFEQYNIDNSIRKHLKKDIYGMLLPIPEFRDKFVTKDDIGQRYFVIEHYFSDEILENNNMKGTSILGTEVFKVKNGKDKFSKNIKSLDKVGFECFKLLFEEIDKIINEKSLRLSIQIKELISSFNVVEIIQKMQIGSIENFEEIKVELAKELKKIMQQESKTWGNAKQKALERKIYIKGLIDQKQEE